jgi:ubiquinone/menaquinone biosynthesis C-methylase UbiE
MMAFKGDPKKYNHWYHTPYGSWVGQLEFSLLSQLIQADKNSTLLDVGCGTGYFSRQFSAHGLDITAIDSESGMIDFAIRENGDIHYIRGDALALPFIHGEFDYSTAITSLCFISEPHRALAEMWRVSKKAVVLGLLNRHSLLYLQKAGKGSYKGARWDSTSDIKQCINQLSPEPSQVNFRSVLFIPEMGFFSKKTEPLFSNKLQLGGFLAVSIHH